mgnify:CR=1 FL=1
MQPTIAVESSYWQDLTINTMVPAPASESKIPNWVVLAISSAALIGVVLAVLLSGGEEGSQSGQGGLESLRERHAGIQRLL